MHLFIREQGAVLMLLLLSPFAAVAQAQDKPETDFYSLVLAEYDLKTATKSMVVYDTDEDGFLDSQEQSRLRWRDEAKDFDLNHDGKLTHLELAVRHAKIRDDNDITQFDINNALRVFRKHDSDNNEILDAKELKRGLWPPNASEYDENRDGQISHAEAIRYMAFTRGLRREFGIEAVDHSRASKIIHTFDADRNSKLDPSEHANTYLPRQASDFDRDGDAMLDPVELATMYSKHRRDLGLTNSDQLGINRLFSIFDRDLNGTISTQERKSIALAPGAVFGAGENDRVETDPLAKFDADNNGTITTPEVEKHFAKIRKERGYIAVDFTKASKMIQRHDRNKSKHIEPDELDSKPTPGRLSKSVLKSSDENKDGRISLNELARYFARQRTGAK